MRAETILQQEIVLRLKGLPMIVCPIPNGFWVPAKTPAERSMVAKIIASMKRSGQLVPGMPDLVLLWANGCGALELKRPKSRDLLRARPAGRRSDSQLEFAKRCAELGINYACVDSWEQTQAALLGWGLFGSWRESAA